MELHIQRTNVSQSSEVEKEVSEYLSGALLEKRQKSTGILGSEGHILPKIGKTS